jgi:DedD protein
MTASADDVNVDDLRRRARRRLVGAIVLALGAAVFVPMLLESDPKPLGEDVAVKIPPVDEGKFVNRLSEKGKSDPAKASPARSDAAKADGAKGNAHPTDSAKADLHKSEPAKADAPKDEPRSEAAKADAPREAASAEAPKESAPLPAKRTIAEAEQKMLGAPAKAAPGPATAAKSPPAPSSAPAPPASAPPVASPSAQGDAVAGFSVQLAAFSDDKGANALANKLKKAGYAAYTEPLETSKGTLWRVRVGPYPSREAAAAGRDKLKGEGYSGIVAAAR